jgi:hypothetical protein
MNKNNYDRYRIFRISVITITQKLRSENEDLKQTVADQEHRIKKMLDALDTISKVSCNGWMNSWMNPNNNVRSMFLNINQVAVHAVAYVTKENV